MNLRERGKSKRGLISTEKCGETSCTNSSLSLAKEDTPESVTREGSSLKINEVAKINKIDKSDTKGAQKWSFKLTNFPY